MAPTEKKWTDDKFLRGMLAASTVLMLFIVAVGSNVHPDDGSEGSEEATEGFWGEITANVDWCEENYAMTYYIAEFWNTVSNSAYVLVGIMLFLWHPDVELRYQLLFASIIVLGAGSALFHGSLTFMFQLCDEVPMFITVACFFIIACEHHTVEVKNKALPWVVTVSMVVFTGLYSVYQFATLFQVSFGIATIVTTVMIIKITLTVPPKDRVSLQAGVVCFMVSLTLWLLEQALCSPFIRAFRLHAWWHLGTATTLYTSSAGVVYIRARNVLKKRNARLTYRFGFIPVAEWDRPAKLPVSR